jgi:SAM-dependent methyltransferase
MPVPMDSEAWDRRYSDPKFVWTSDPNRFLVSEISQLSAPGAELGNGQARGEPGRALDVACGEGRNAVWLAERGWRVTGVDFSSVGLEKARGLARSRRVAVEWVAADLMQYEPEPGAFELVIVFYLQVAAAARQAILRSVAVAVAQGGAFLLVAHDASNIEHGYGGPQDPAVLYTAQDVVDDLAQSGLDVQRAVTVKRPVQTADGERVALDALVRARRLSPR